MKKLVSLILVLVMVMAFMVPTASATEPTTGSITIINATENVKYSIYKVFDLTYSGSNVAYTYTKTGDTDALYTALTDNDSPFTLTASSTANIYNVTAKENTTGETIGTWLKNNISNLTETSSAVATSATVTFSSVAYGYYYVTSTLGTTVTVDSAMPNASITDKNEKPTIEKKVKDGENWADTNNVNIGDTVEYKADITVKTGAKNYVLHDTISAGLTFDSNSVSVKVGTTDVASTNYTVTSAGLTDGCTFEIAFTNNYLATLTSNTVISVYYSAKLSDNAVIAGTGNTNTVKLTYGDSVEIDEDNDPNTEAVSKTPETTTDTTTTYAYALALKKVNQSGTALANATFQLPFYVKSTPDSNGTYIYGGTSTGEGLINSLTTPTSGEITIKGIKAGTYNITETKAPEGYNKLTSAVSATVTAQTVTNTNVTKYLDANGNVSDTSSDTSITYSNTNLAADVVFVVNKTGTELPSTGGVGTTIFYVLGGLMFVGALVLLVTNKRMKAE